MNTLTDLTPSLIMASGLKRISALTTQYGITSPQVWDACVRWGGILDDVNHPDTTCRYCGEAVTFESNVQTYYHIVTKSKHCATHAGRTAAPFEVKGTTTGRLANANPDLKVIPIPRSAVTNLYAPRKLTNYPG